METKAPNRRRRKQYSNKQVCIPQEVQEEIIVGLPVKAVVRFKSVDKAWLRMIESGSFRNTYNRRHRHDYSNKLVYSPYSSSRKMFMEKSPSPLIDTIKLSPGPLDLRLPQKLTRLIRPGDEDQGYDDDEDDEDDYYDAGDYGEDEEWRHVVRVMGPLSNGVYMVVNYYRKGIDDVFKGHGISMATGKLALCNPAMHDYKLISTFPCHDDSDPSYSLLSRLGRKECRVHYGFGMGGGGDYKVVVVIGWGPRFSSFLSFVYSLQRGTWTKIVDYQMRKRHYCNRKATTEGLFLEEQGRIRYPEITLDLELCPQRFFKGSWHWMAVRTRANKKYTLLLFDFADDSFRLMDAPPPSHTNAHCHRQTSSVCGSGLFVLNDHLVALFYTHPCHTIEVWMMMDYGVPESWTKIHAIEPDCFTSIRRLVGISPGGYGNIETLFFHDHKNQLVSFDAASGQYEEHGLFDISSGIWWNTLGISTYKETLDPL